MSKKNTIQIKPTFEPSALMKVYLDSKKQFYEGKTRAENVGENIESTITNQTHIESLLRRRKAKSDRYYIKKVLEPSEGNEWPIYPDDPSVYGWR